MRFCVQSFPSHSLAHLRRVVSILVSMSIGFSRLLSLSPLPPHLQFYFYLFIIFYQKVSEFAALHLTFFFILELIISFSISILFFKISREKIHNCSSQEIAVKLA